MLRVQSIEVQDLVHMVIHRKPIRGIQCCIRNGSAAHCFEVKCTDAYLLPACDTPSTALHSIFLV